MTNLQKKTRVIPTTAWVIAITLYLLVSTLVFLFAYPHNRAISDLPLAGKIAISYGIVLILLAYILLIGYVYGDAKRRGMRYVMWTLLSIFIPNGIGIILYFILRDPLPSTCPSCGILVKSGFTFCPHCSTALGPACPKCGRAVERGWSHCPYCGTAITAARTSGT